MKLLLHFVFIASDDRAAFDIVADVDVGGIPCGLFSLGLVEHAAEQFFHINLDQSISIFYGMFFKSILFQLKQVIVIQRIGIRRFGDWDSLLRVQPLD